MLYNFSSISFKIRKIEVLTYVDCSPREASHGNRGAGHGNRAATFRTPLTPFTNLDTISERFGPAKKRKK